MIELADDEPPAVGRAVNGNSVVVGGAGGGVGAFTGVSGSIPEQHPNISPSSVGQQFPSNSLFRHVSYAEHSATTGGAGTPPSVGFALGAGRPLMVGLGVGFAVGDFVGEGVVVPGQSVSHDLIHSSSGSHQEYPADGMQPFSSRSLPGAGRFTGASVGDEVGSGATHR